MPLIPKPTLVKTNSGKLSLPKVLETYVHVLMASCFQEEGLNIRIDPRQSDMEDFDDSIFRYHGAPGKRNLSGEFHHFDLSLQNNNRALELHLGVEVMGNSSIFHEIDVLICNRIFLTGNIYFSDMILASEVKRYNEKIRAWQENL